MNILHIIENLDEAYGGPAKSVPELCQHLKRINNVECELISVGNPITDKNELIELYDLTWHIARRSFPNFWYYSTKLERLLQSRIEAFLPDLIHIHSIWTYPTLIACKLARRNGIKYVISPRSSLYSDSLRRGRLRKKLALRFYLMGYLESCNLIHTTEENELKDVRKLGITKDIAIIPNGVSLKSYQIDVTKETALSKLSLPNNRRYLLFLSRIHPRKQLTILVNLWIDNSGAYQNWDLIVAGPIEDEKYFNQILKIVRTQKLKDRFHYLGFISGDTRKHALKACDIFVLLSKFENFGMSIIEAMASSKPVFVSTGTPWQAIKENEAGWWVDTSSSSLSKLFTEALSKSTAQLAQMGSKSFDLAKTYDWDTQAKKMHHAYGYLLNDNVSPPKYINSV